MQKISRKKMTFLEALSSFWVKIIPLSFCWITCLPILFVKWIWKVNCTYNCKFCLVFFALLHFHLIVFRRLIIFSSKSASLTQEHWFTKTQFRIFSVIMYRRVNPCLINFSSFPIWVEESLRVRKLFRAMFTVLEKFVLPTTLPSFLPLIWGKIQADV